MKRRNFLKSMLAVPLVGIVPALAANKAKVRNMKWVAYNSQSISERMFGPDATIYRFEDFDEYERNELVRKMHEAHMNTKFKKPLNQSSMITFKKCPVLYGSKL